MSLVIDNVKFAYKNHEVLKGVSFEAGNGELVSILGPNGVGKSTLFKCILKLLTPCEGDIFVDGISIREMSMEAMAKKIAYIPQFHSPIFNYSVFDVILMGTTAQMSKFAVPREKQVKIAEEAMELLNISPIKDKSYLNISGGERQMTLIARAIAQQAKILVMDEPSASLDFGNRIRLMKTIKSLTKEGYTVIQSTHDPEQAYFYSNKIVAMHEGRVVDFGYPDDVVNNETISLLYGMDVDVISVDRRVVSCVPKDLHRVNKREY